jgi:hypothetical protein
MDRRIQMTTLLGKVEDRLNKKIPTVRDIFMALFLPGLIASCPPNAYGEGANQANPSGYHSARANYYEEMAMNLSVKTKEQEQLLEHYEERSYLYGKRAQDLQAHTRALIRKYKRASAENLKIAANHRQISYELESNGNFSSRQQIDELTSN